MPRRDARYIGQFRPEFSRLYRDRDLYWVAPFAAPLVLAVSGPRFAGVTTTLGYLSERHGFHLYTLGGELRRIAEQRGVSIESRRYLQDLGDELRTERRDAAYLARVVGRHIRHDRLRDARRSTGGGKVAIGGLKHPRELRELQKLTGFHLAILDAGEYGADTRYPRVLENGVLRAEYEAEPDRRAEAMPWSALKDEERRGYFDELERGHREGHQSHFPAEYRGRPAAVIAQARELVDGAAERVHTLDNSTRQFDDLQRAIDKLIDDLRPAEEVVHHGHSES